jgi:hypothetical protein
MHPHLSTELALKAFEADVAFNAALAEFQKGPPEATIIAEARRAAGHGFSWFARPSDRCLASGFVEVRLRHAAGAEITADGKSITALLAGLLGHPLAQDLGVIAANQAAEPEKEEAGLEEALAVATQGTACKAALLASSSPAPQACPRASSAQAAEQLAPQSQPVTGAMVASSLAAAAGESLAAAIAALPPSPAQAAAESLAAATGGAVVEEEPDEAERTRLARSLTDEERRACLDGIKLLTAEQRKSFTIAFRDVFKVAREEKAITPLITQVRHMEFCDRYAIEALGGVAA